MAFHVSLLSLVCLQNVSSSECLSYKGKRVFHVSTLSLACLGNGYESDRISYIQTSTCHLRHMVYVTVVMFVCPYVCTIFSHPCITVYFGVVETVRIVLIVTICIGMSTALSH